MPGVRSPRARLGAFLVVLGALAVGVLLLSPVSEEGLRDALEPFGVAAPLAFVALSALLGSLFVPGPVLAGAGGLLFGTVTGVLVSVAAAVLSAAVSVLAARGVGREGVVELEHPRVLRVEALLRRHGVLAVVVQRLLPAVPDAPCSYLFGLAGLGAGTVALGTLVGAAPRAFSFSAIGDGLGGGDGTLAAAGVAVWVATGLLGIGLALAVGRADRRERR